MLGYSNDPMPSDKLMRLFIIQAISSFVSRDYESGLHYLNEIKQTYAQHMTSMNPTLKGLAKEIIQSLDLFSPGSTAEDLSLITNEGEKPVQQPTTTDTQDSEQEQPASVASELQNLLNRRRERKSRR